MEPSTRSQELNQITLKFLNAFNQGDVDAIMSFFSADAVYEELHGKKNEGTEAIRKSFEKLFSGKFGKIQFDENDTFIDPSENKVMSSWDLSIDIDGTRKSMSGLDLLHFKGNLITFKGTFVKAVEALYKAK